MNRISTVSKKPKKRQETHTVLLQLGTVELTLRFDPLALDRCIYHCTQKRYG